eukprot:5605671-Alexandrium_andersonii.AAC.1
MLGGVARRAAAAGRIAARRAPSSHTSVRAAAAVCQPDPPTAQKPPLHHGSCWPCPVGRGQSGCARVAGRGGRAHSVQPVPPRLRRAADR